MHYTPRFIEAMERVTKAENHRQAFYDEMVAIGYKERIKNLYRIKDKATGKFVFFQPNREQVTYQDQKKNRNIILKSRQIGFTTYSCIYAYDRAKWDAWSTGIMSHKKEQTQKIFEIVKNANYWFKKDWSKFYEDEQSSDSSTSIVWEDTKASITVAYDFKGLTCRFLHASEAAFIETSRLVDSLQSVPESGEVTLESTADGAAGFFYDQWQLHKTQGEFAPYKGFFFPWHEHYPEDITNWENMVISPNDKELELLKNTEIKHYHLAWRRWKINESCNGEEELFDVHYPADDVSCFLGGTSQVFPMSALTMQQQFVKDPSWIGTLFSENNSIVPKKDPKGIVSMWDFPKPESTYAIGLDTAEGISKDYSVAIVINRATGEQVAMLRGYIPLDELAGEVWKLGMYYNRAWVCPEVNNTGHAVLNDLVHKGYGKIYKRKEGSENIFGFRTTQSTKPELIKNFVSACKDGSFRARSHELLKEMTCYVQTISANKKIKMGAKHDAHDDCIIAAALAWEMHKKSADYLENTSYKIPEDMEYDAYTGFLMPKGYTGDSLYGE